LFFNSELHDFGGVVIFKGNLNKKYLAKFIHISDAFITEILNMWSEISYDDNITSTENLLSFPFWQNLLLRIGNKPIYYKSWSSNGIQNVRLLIKAKQLIGRYLTNSLSSALKLPNELAFSNKLFSKQNRH